MYKVTKNTSVAQTLNFDNGIFRPFDTWMVNFLETEWMELRDQICTGFFQYFLVGLEPPEHQLEFKVYSCNCMLRELIQRSQWKGLNLVMDVSYLKVSGSSHVRTTLRKNSSSGRGLLFSRSQPESVFRSILLLPPPFCNHFCVGLQTHFRVSWNKQRHWDAHVVF